jgi:hypothetical protein
VIPLSLEVERCQYSDEQQQEESTDG